MATKKEYLEFVLEQLSPLEGVSHRAMMGEYVVYYEGKVIGGIYDDRFLIKPTPGALRVMTEAGKTPVLEIPYEGAKPMLLADIDDRELTIKAVAAAAADLPLPKKRK